MSRLTLAWAMTLALACWGGRANAQEAGAPGAGGSSLGESPGAGGGAPGTSPAAGEGILGGRPGPSFPRVPSGITRPGGPAEAPAGRGIGPIPHVPEAELPLYGRLELPTGPEAEGPPDGLTLDQAIETLIQSNLDLRAKAVEIPKAQADVLTASLRANPLFYADTQFIPYGRLAPEAGPTQYDVNINHPFDLSGKRRARTEVACRAKRVLEAQYQDAVRLTIDNLYSAWVDVLAARETVLLARTSIEGLNQVLETTRALERKGAATPAEVNRVKIQRDTAEVALQEVEVALLDAKRALGVLLNTPPEAVASLEVRGRLGEVAPPPPPVQELVRIALGGRPDLVAYRIGIKRAEADVGLARANRFEDVFLLYQPFTYQDRREPGSEGSLTSWAVGLTVPLPIYNRNQGNIQRARLNVGQTRIQLADQERRAVAEVERAAQAHEVTQAAVRRFEQEILGDARQARDTALELYTAGEADQITFLEAQRAYNEVVRQYRDALVRHRRAMLRLNTAVGQRILP